MENRKRKPALGLQAREDELIAAATEEAEKRILNGKASDSLLIHYLKLGTTKMKLDKESAKADVILKKAKAKSIESQDMSRQLILDAINAMKEYTGQAIDDE